MSSSFEYLINFLVDDYTMTKVKLNIKNLLELKNLFDRVKEIHKNCINKESCYSVIILYNFDKEKLERVVTNNEQIPRYDLIEIQALYYFDVSRIVKVSKLIDFLLDIMYTCQTNILIHNTNKFPELNLLLRYLNYNDVEELIDDLKYARTVFENLAGMELRAKFINERVRIKQFIVDDEEYANIIKNDNELAKVIVADSL